MNPLLRELNQINRHYKAQQREAREALVSASKAQRELQTIHEDFPEKELDHLIPLFEQDVEQERRKENLINNKRIRSLGRELDYRSNTLLDRVYAGETTVREELFLSLKERLHKTTLQEQELHSDFYELMLITKEPFDTQSKYFLEADLEQKRFINKWWTPSPVSLVLSVNKSLSDQIIKQTSMRNSANKLLMQANKLDAYIRETQPQLRLYFPAS
ncbi:MAG: hypothetical protein ACMXYD_00445 [Candidatus Woesearchaeota archaeon]